MHPPACAPSRSRISEAPAFSKAVATTKPRFVSFLVAKQRRLQSMPEAFLFASKTTEYPAWASSERRPTPSEQGGLRPGLPHLVRLHVLHRGWPPHEK